MMSLIDQVTGATARNAVRAINEQLRGCDRMETVCRDLLHGTQVRKADLLNRRSELLAQYNMLDGVALEAAAVHVGEDGGDFPAGSFSPPPFFSNPRASIAGFSLDTGTSQVLPRDPDQEPDPDPDIYLSEFDSNGLA